MGKIIKDYNTIERELIALCDRERTKSANLSEAEQHYYFAIADITTFMFEIFEAAFPPEELVHDMIEYAERSIARTKQEILLETNEEKRAALIHLKNGYIAAKNLMYAPDDTVVKNA